jgi:hypothetical protein
MKRDRELEKLVEQQLLLLVPREVLACVELHCGLDDEGQALILEAAPVCGASVFAVPPLPVRGPHPSAPLLSARVRLLALALEAWAGWDAVLAA